MGRSGQAYIAATYGTSFTLYAACRASGIALTPEQERFQAELETKYPPIVGQEEVNDASEEAIRDA